MTTLEGRGARGGRIAFLDYLRIFAFISVLGWHKFYPYAQAYEADESVHATPRLILRALLPLIEFGGAGVVVFFLVSGYIITYVLQTEQPVEFILKRIFRIYPLYIVAVIIQTLISGAMLSPLVMIPRLLLIGDFFNTPYALSGVEWTLRAEVVFYAFMAALKSLGLMHKWRRWLLWSLVAATLALGVLTPIPSADSLFKGSFTIYFPFLFLGVAFFLSESKQISIGLLLAFAGLVLFHYYSLIALYEPVVKDAHFATLALLVFAFAWAFRVHIVATPLVLFASDLTYSIYLFHSWVWEPLKTVMGWFSLTLLHPDLQALVAMLALCICMSTFVEKPGIRLGQRLMNHLLARRRADPIRKP